MKTSELTGAQLDYWVARAEGMEPSVDSQMRFMPSSDWAHGGPIIERERIDYQHRPVPDRPHSFIVEAECIGREAIGRTVLEASMRAYVASKFGEEVADDRGGQDTGG